MIVSAIAAIDRIGLIGDAGRIPWRLPGDLARFRLLTLGNPVIMGRKTFESLRRPLDHRPNIVLSGDFGFRAAGCLVVRSVEEAFEAASKEAVEAFVIGGSSVYGRTIGLWDRVHLTVVHGEFRGDAYFPLAGMAKTPWNLIRREYRPANSRDMYPHWFLDFSRPAAAGSRAGPGGASIRGIGYNPCADDAARSVECTG